MKDAKQIAAGLTKAQREALIALCDRGSSPYGYYASELGVSGAAMAALLSKGLVMSSHVYGDKVTAYRPRAEGLAVRAELEASDADR